jgi:hypothetical protein
MGQQTISRSTKPRQGVFRFKQNGNLMKEFDKYSRQWVQVVEKDSIGKNKKGKTIYSSRTRHIPA